MTKFRILLKQNYSVHDLSSSSTRRFSWQFLRPELVFITVNAIAIVLWLFTPGRIANALIPNGRYVSFTSLLYLILCLVSFWLGANFLRHRLKTKDKPRLLFYLFHDPIRSPRILRVLMFIAFIISFCAVFGNVLLLYKGFSLYGNIGGYISEVYEGTSFGKLKRTYFGAEQRVPGLTTLIYLTPVSAILSYLIMKSAKRFQKKRFYRFGLVFFLASMFPGVIALTITHGSRTPLLLTLIPLIFCHIFLSFHLDNRVFTKAVRNLSILGILVLFAFATGDYIRNYLPGQQGHYSISQDIFGVTGFFDSVVSNFLSYFFRTVNNSLIIVDYIDTHTYFYRIFNWFYSGFNITEIDPGGLIYAVRNQMSLLDMKGISFFGASNASIFGYYFIDLSWGAVFIFFFLGHVCSRLYAGLRDWSLLSWLIYPILCSSLLDSWRTDVLTKTPVVLPVFASILIFGLIKLKFPKYS